MAMVEQNSTKILSELELLNREIMDIKQTTLHNESEADYLLLECQNLRQSTVDHIYNMASGYRDILQEFFH